MFHGCYIIYNIYLYIYIHIYIVLLAEILKQLKKAKKTAYQALLKHLKENKLTEVHDGKYLYFEAYGELERLSVRCY